MTDIIKALETARCIAAEALENAQRAFAGHPQKYAAEKRDFDEIDAALASYRASVDAVELPEPEGYKIDWPEEPELEFMFSEDRPGESVNSEALYTASTVRSLIAAAVEREKSAWRASLAPVFSERMGAEQVREKVQAAIRARGEMK